MTTIDLDLEISIDIPCSAWIEALPDVEQIVATAAQASITRTCASLEQAEVSIVLLDDASQQVLNGKWRGQDRSTNVLSFPATETEAGVVPEPEFPGVPLVLGDLSLAFETIRDEAITQGKSLNHHVSHLVVHGILHLLGYDHLDDAQAAVMEALEINILAGLGVADPYEQIDQREITT